MEEFGLVEISVPYEGQPSLGMVIDGGTNAVLDVQEGGLADRCGIQAGDLIIQINGQTATFFNWHDGSEHGLMRLLTEPQATRVAKEMLDPTRSVQVFRLLRRVGPHRAAEAQVEQIATPEQVESPTPDLPEAQERPAPAQPEETGDVQKPLEAIAPQPTAAEAQREAERRRAAEVEANMRAARDMYPWATQIETPDGELKAKYNIGQAVLAPLPQVHATRETLMRKDAFMASLKK